MWAMGKEWLKKNEVVPGMNRKAVRYALGLPKVCRGLGKDPLGNETDVVYYYYRDRSILVILDKHESRVQEVLYKPTGEFSECR